MLSMERIQIEDFYFEPISYGKRSLGLDIFKSQRLG